MKRTLLSLVLLALALPALPQEPAPAPDAPPPPNRPFRPGFEGNRARFGGPGGMATERWLEHVREKRPEECQRLMELRQKDPDLFRKEMQTHLRKEIAARIEREHPALQEAIRNLPEADREWLLSRMTGGDWPGARSQELQKPDAEEHPDGRLRHKIQEFQKSQDESERTRLRKELRDELKASFDDKQARRREELNQLETRLKLMREQLESRAADSDRLIDAKLLELTGSGRR